MKRLANLFSALIITMFVVTSFVACESETDSDGTPSTTVTPKAGTTYTYAKQQRDSVSGESPTTTDSIVVATVISSGTTFEGKSNVISLDDDGDTLRYVMESNGDVSIYLKELFTYGDFTFISPEPWLKYPLGSKMSGVVLFEADTNMQVQSFSVPVHITATANYLGTEELKKDGNAFADGGKAEVVVTVNGSLSGVNVTVVGKRSLSFDPKIGGYFRSTDETIIPDVKVLGQTFLQGNTSLTTKILTSFSLIK